MPHPPEYGPFRYGFPYVNGKERVNDVILLATNPPKSFCIKVHQKCVVGPS